MIERSEETKVLANHLVCSDFRHTCNCRTSCVMSTRCRHRASSWLAPSRENFDRVRWMSIAIVSLSASSYSVHVVFFFFQTTLPEFRESEFSVVRQHEEFIWLHDRYEENEDYAGIVVSQCRFDLGSGLKSRARPGARCCFYVVDQFRGWVGGGGG